MVKSFKPSYGAGFIIRIIYHWFIIFRNYSGFSRIKMFYYVSKINVKKWFNKWFEFKNEELFGFKIYFPNYSYFRSLFYEIFAAKSYYFYTKNKTPLIIDCGSNIGMSVLFFKNIYPHAKIIAFEPHNPTFNVLLKNIKSNRLVNVKPLNLALSDKEGVTTIYTPEKCGSGDTTIFKSMTESFKKTYIAEIRTVKLSNFVNENVDILKLDVEGAEGLIIKELHKNDRLKYIKNIVMEYHHNRTKENDLADILVILKKNDFKLEFQSIKYPPLDFYKNNNYTMMIFAHKNL